MAAASDGGSQSSLNKKSNSSKDLLNIDPNRVYKPFDIKDTMKEITGPPKIRSLGQSKVLSKVKTFLPLIEASNIKLESFLKENDQADLDIENVEDSGRFIEMNIGLVEENDANWMCKLNTSDLSDDDLASGTESSSSEVSSDDVEFGCNIGEVTESNFRTTLPCSKKKRLIKEITIDKTADGDRTENYDSCD